MCAIALCMSSQVGAQTLSSIGEDISGDISIVRDPTIIRQGHTYYLFSTDPAVHSPNQYIPMRCSEDRVEWRFCGHVFDAIPEWAKQAAPGATGLWAPDISFFNGLYHLYYSASTTASQTSGIGFATNVTLESGDPRYRWIDHGPLLMSRAGDDFNAIDPNVFIGPENHIWLNYGSFWSGIKQRELSRETGMFLTKDEKPWSLAFRPDHRVVEGPSMLFRDGYFYLFISYGRCCSAKLSEDDYREAVGRSKSPHGPFVDKEGQLLSRGGGTIILEGDGTWVAPGGGSVWSDPESGKFVLVFHALDVEHKGRATLWVKTLKWKDGWPMVEKENLAAGD